MQTIAGEIPVQYDESKHTYNMTHDWGSDQSMTTAIVMAVSAITDTSPTEIEPIHRVVDPDALENLYAPRGNAKVRRDDSSTSFRFHGCSVTVYSTGEIKIQPRDESDDVVDTDYR